MRAAGWERCIVLALLAAGGSAAASADEAPACAHAPAELRASTFPAAPGVPLRQAKAAEYAFAVNATCLEREDGVRTPAMLIRVEPTADPVNLHLTSVSGREVTLPARVELLDQGFAALKSYPFDRFVKRGMDYSATLFLGAFPQPRYLLVLPDAEWLGRSNQLTAGNRWTTVWSTGTVMGSFSNGTEQRKEQPFASGGTLRVEVESDARVVGTR